jgi:hypothetical protein
MKTLIGAALGILLVASVAAAGEGGYVDPDWQPLPRR